MVTFELRCGRTRVPGVEPGHDTQLVIGIIGTTYRELLCAAHYTRFTISTDDRVNAACQDLRGGTGTEFLKERQPSKKIVVPLQQKGKQKDIVAFDFELGCQELNLDLQLGTEMTALVGNNGGIIKTQNELQSQAKKIALELYPGARNRIWICSYVIDYLWDHYRELPLNLLEGKTAVKGRCAKNPDQSLGGKIAIEESTWFELPLQEKDAQGCKPRLPGVEPGYAATTAAWARKPSKKSTKSELVAAKKEGFDLEFGCQESNLDMQLRN
ncbi:hypothetical protein C8R45DRAFT_947215 [Mycena sanguinolenta]|nr:hypothetical protein C8R45DRAFT_947215 [Mycena sanguinolenta]